MAKILVVEDEPVSRQILVNAVQKEGHFAFGAASAEQALSITKEFVPDVVISDFLLKGDLNGGRLCQMLSQKFTNLKCILVTGLPAAEIEKEIAVEGNVRIVEKPIELAEVLNAVGYPIRR